MLKRFTSPYTGSVLFIQRPREVADFLARQPQVLPVAPPAQPATSLAYRLALKALALIAILLVMLLIAAWFFLFGEDSQRVRPELTPAQRAAAFRIPHAQK